MPPTDLNTVAGTEGHILHLNGLVRGLVQQCGVCPDSVQYRLEAQLAILDRQLGLSGVLLFTAPPKQWLDGVDVLAASVYQHLLLHQAALPKWKVTSIPLVDLASWLVKHEAAALWTNHVPDAAGEAGASQQAALLAAASTVVPAIFTHKPDAVVQNGTMVAQVLPRSRRRQAQAIAAVLASLCASAGSPSEWIVQEAPSPCEVLVAALDTVLGPWVAARGSPAVARVAARAALASIALHTCPVPARAHAGATSSDSIAFIMEQLAAGAAADTAEAVPATLGWTVDSALFTASAHQPLLAADLPAGDSDASTLAQLLAADVAGVLGCETADETSLAVAADTAAAWLLKHFSLVQLQAQAGTVKHDSAVLSVGKFTVLPAPAGAAALQARLEDMGAEASAGLSTAVLDGERQLQAWSIMANIQQPSMERIHEGIDAVEGQALHAQALEATAACPPLSTQQRAEESALGHAVVDMNLPAVKTPEQLAAEKKYSARHTKTAVAKTQMLKSQGLIQGANQVWMARRGVLSHAHSAPGAAAVDEGASLLPVSIERGAKVLSGPLSGFAPGEIPKFAAQYLSNPGQVHCQVPLAPGLPYDPLLLVPRGSEHTILGLLHAAANAQVGTVVALNAVPERVLDVMNAVPTDVASASATLSAEFCVRDTDDVVDASPEATDAEGSPAEAAHDAAGAAASSPDAAEADGDEEADEFDDMQDSGDDENDDEDAVAGAGGLAHVQHDMTSTGRRRYVGYAEEPFTGSPVVFKLRVDGATLQYLDSAVHAVARQMGPVWLLLRMVSTRLFRLLQTKPEWSKHEAEALEMTLKLLFKASVHSGVSASVLPDAQRLLAEVNASPAASKLRAAKKELEAAVANFTPGSTFVGAWRWYAAVPSDGLASTTLALQEQSLAALLMRYTQPFFLREVGNFHPRLPFPPDAWQREVVDAVDARHCVFVSAPTSAGKSFASYYAVQSLFMDKAAEDDSVALYIAPTAALCQQALSEIEAYFPFLQESGGAFMLVGGLYSHEGKGLFDYKVLCLTPEQVGGLLMSAEGQAWASRIKYCILDEIHNIVENGLAWQLVTHSLPCPFVALSATVGAEDLFREWAARAAEAKGCGFVAVSGSALQPAAEVAARVSSMTELGANAGAFDLTSWAKSMRKVASELGVAPDVVDSVWMASPRIERWNDIQTTVYVPAQPDGAIVALSSVCNLPLDALVAALTNGSAATASALHTTLPAHESLALVAALVAAAETDRMRLRKAGKAGKELCTAIKHLAFDAAWHVEPCGGVPAQLQARMWGRAALVTLAALHKVRSKSAKLVLSALKRTQTQAVAMSDAVVQERDGDAYIRLHLFQALRDMDKAGLLPSVVFMMQAGTMRGSAEALCKCVQAAARLQLPLLEGHPARSSRDPWEGYQSMEEALLDWAQLYALPATEAALLALMRELPRRLSTLGAAERHEAAHKEACACVAAMQPAVLPSLEAMWQRWQDANPAEGSAQNVSDARTAYLRAETMFVKSARIPTQELRRVLVAPSEDRLTDAEFLSDPFVVALSYGIGIHIPRLKRLIITVQRRYRGTNKSRRVKLQYQLGVENLFRTKRIKVLLATDTLAQGINMPAKSVAFAQDTAQVNSSVYIQMAGRAGRRGRDAAGAVVFLGFPGVRIRQLQGAQPRGLTASTAVSREVVLRHMWSRARLGSVIDAASTVSHYSDEDTAGMRAQIDGMMQRCERLSLALALADGPAGADEELRAELSHTAARMSAAARRMVVQHARHIGLLDSGGAPMHMVRCLAAAWCSEANLAPLAAALLRPGVRTALCAQWATPPNTAHTPEQVERMIALVSWLLCPVAPGAGAPDGKPVAGLLDPADILPGPVRAELQGVYNASALKYVAMLRAELADSADSLGALYHTTPMTQWAGCGGASAVHSPVATLPLSPLATACGARVSVGDLQHCMPPDAHIADHAVAHLGSLWEGPFLAPAVLAVQRGSLHRVASEMCLSYHQVYGAVHRTHKAIKSLYSALLDYEIVARVEHTQAVSDISGAALGQTLHKKLEVYSPYSPVHDLVRVMRKALPRLAAAMPKN